MNSNINWETGAIADAIVKFMIEQNPPITITKETSGEFENKINEEMKNKPKTQAELEMCLMENVMPFFPNTTASLVVGLTSTSSVISSILENFHKITMAIQNNPTKQKVQQSLMKIEDLILKGKIKIQRNLENAKSKASEAVVLKSEAQKLMDALSGEELVSPLAKKVFHDLKSLVEAKGKLSDQEKENLEKLNPENIEEIESNKEKISKKTISESWTSERTARQKMALSYYMKNYELGIVRSALATMVDTKQTFDKITEINVEKGTQNFNPLSDAYLDDYITNKLASINEGLEQNGRDIKEVLDKLKSMHQYTTYTKQDSEGIPPYELAKMLPNSDFATQNWIKLLSLDEIYQHYLQSKSTQKAKISPDKESVSIEDFDKAFSGIDVESFLGPNEKLQLSNFLNKISSEDTMTWKKGMSISLFSDPPVPHTMTMMTGDTVESGDFSKINQTGGPITIELDEANRMKIKKLQSEINELKRRLSITDPNNKNFIRGEKYRIKAQNNMDQKIKELEEMKSQNNNEKTHNRAGATIGRKLFEASRKNAHWATLLAATRSHTVDDGSIEKQKDILNSVLGKMIEKIDESKVSSKTKANNKGSINNIRRNIDEALGVDSDRKQLTPKEVVVTAIENPNIPYWILMRAVQYPFDRSTRDLALYNLESTKGWTPVLDKAKKPMLDDEGDIIWKKTKESKPTSKKESSIRISKREVFSQMDTSRNLDQQIDAANKTKQATEQLAQSLQKEKQIKMQTPTSPAQASPAPAPANTPASYGVNAAGVKTWPAASDRSPRMSKRG